MKISFFRAAFLIALCSCTSLMAKIYDCFLFYNEFEILNIRLEELNDSVDYFVLVESCETFRGAPKPFHFDENKHLYEKFLHKIIHVKLYDRQPNTGAWERESFQRNCIARGLTHCVNNDVIFISDLDEIPRHEIIPSIQYNLLHKHVYGFALQQTIYFFQLNRSPPNGLHEGTLWFGTAVTTYKNFKTKGAQSFREKSRAQKLEKIYNAGWHFTYMGGLETVKAKIQGFSHGFDDVSYLDTDWDMYLVSRPAVPIDDSFPKYVIDNLEYYKSIGFIADYP
ncbi:MAG: hypothetical protein K2P51_03755 [Rhabdochlamydiaceae bacterium]|nr:hypothetical protein [Rhabdochlamydiaceae bacterium]